MTGMSRCAVFIFDLLQDVNILWPIARLAAEETDLDVVLLVSDRFTSRDTGARWRSELEELAWVTHGSIHPFGSPYEAYQVLQSRTGVIFAGSESDLNAHSTSHGIFRSAPRGFVRVTLQHGYECVGFLQNREQSMVFGESITFAADVVCSWMAPERLHHLGPAERDKLVVTGPSALASQALPPIAMTGDKRGLVCENLHSVRMNAAGDFKASYMDTFFAFADGLAAEGKTVALRPHPGGQYVVRNDVKLPANVSLANEPMYRTNLGQFAFGISAPSSVLIDMVLAGIPTAVWVDGDARIDAGNYEGLTQVSSLAEWASFATAACADPAPFVEQQQAFLERTGILRDRNEVRRRFVELFGLLPIGHGDAEPALKVLYIANAEIPTLQLGFMKPLKPLREAGVLREHLITESDLRRKMGKQLDEARAVSWMSEEIDRYRPDIVVFCRYSGPCADAILEKLEKHSVPAIFHIDDDLLNVPLEIGEAKYREHNRPERLNTVTTLLRKTDLVYCSTKLLRSRFNELGFSGKMAVGKIYCSASVLAPAVERPVTKIGYMGFDHAHDLELALPELVEFLRERPEVVFELFGSIPKPAALDEFGDRISVIPPVRPYEAFLEHFASLGWDIGICPLATTDFNRVKANTKWVEYTCVGAAVVATAGMAYDECCDDGCGVLVEGATGWKNALHRLCDDPAERFRMVVAAQDRIRDEYAVADLQSQVLAMFDKARHSRAGSDREPA